MKNNVQMKPLKQTGTGGKSDKIPYAAGTGSRPGNNGKNAIPSSAPGHAQKIRG